MQCIYKHTVYSYFKYNVNSSIKYMLTYITILNLSLQYMLT